MDWLGTFALSLALVAGACGSGPPPHGGGPNDLGGTDGPSTDGPGSDGRASGTDGGSSAFDFPHTAPWYQDVSQAALDSESARVIAGLAAAGGWGAGNRMQIDFSIRVLTADQSVVPRAFTPTADFYSPDCDPVPIPVPPGGAVEGGSDYACPGGDCHLLVYQGARLYEAWVASITGGQAAGGTFTSGCAVVWELGRDYWSPAAPGAFARGEQCSSADAAGYPIAPLLFTGGELSAGKIAHAIRFILPNARIRHGEYVHPATHSTNPTAGGPDTPPYGARLRLRSSFDLTTLPNDAARTVARALMTYGMFLADGGQIALTAEVSAAAQLGSGDLAALAVTDFEMIDGGARVPYTSDCTRTPVTN